MVATDIVGILVTTIILGSIYGLVAIGMTLIYGTLRILDMSQGSMVMVGSFIGWGILVVAGWNPILAIILLIGGLSGWRRFKERRAGAEGNPAYYRVAPLHRFAVGFVYVALIAVLVLGMHASFVDRSAHITG